MWENFKFVWGALRAHRLRSILSALGVSIGVAAVVLLTSLGEGTREYIVSQFTQFGTNLVAVMPGKVKTFGMPGVFGGTTHPLTLEDVEALQKVPEVVKVIPVIFGQARVSAEGRGRGVFVYGTTHDAPELWQFPVGQGEFLPEMDIDRKGAFAVLGPKLARELFKEKSPLGERVRIGEQSFVVLGIMEPKGQLLGFDLDDAAYIPVATAMSLFNVHEMNEIDILAASSDAIPRVVEGVTEVLIQRHRGDEDFTVVTQTEMLDTFGKVLGIVTVAVTGIGGISLFVGAMGILTIMWISVHERTREIGLLRALGVSRAGVERLFLMEAVLLAGVGGAIGVGISMLLIFMVHSAVPGLPVSTPSWAIGAALLMSLIVGMGSGYLPARRAAGLDPVEALREE